MRPNSRITSQQARPSLRFSRTRASPRRRSPFGAWFVAFASEDPLMQKIRYLDKLVDELAKGRPLNKVLRS